MRERNGEQQDKQEINNKENTRNVETKLITRQTKQGQLTTKQKKMAYHSTDSMMFFYYSMCK